MEHLVEPDFPLRRTQGMQSGGEALVSRHWGEHKSRLWEAIEPAYRVQLKRFALKNVNMVDSQ